MTQNKLKILFASAASGFCYYYRIKYPAEHLKEWFDIRYVGANEGDALTDGIIWADIIVFHYAAPNLVVTKMQAVCTKFHYPKLFVAEFDDDYLHIDPTNINYREWGIVEVPPHWVDGKDGFSIKDNQQHVKVLKEAIAACDLITVTSEVLKKSYEPYNKNITVLKNCINPEVMPKETVKHDRDKVVIAWQGGDSHAGELAQHMKVLEDIKATYGDKVQFKSFGSQLAKRFFDKVDAEFVPWIRPNLFYSIFAKHPIDIGMVIVNDTVFNRAKSNIKWLEYSYYNIPTIARNIPPYGDTIVHGSTGLLYNDGNGLYLGLCRLIEDPLYRAALAGQAQRHVLKNYTIQDHAYLWRDAYQKAYLQKFGSSKDTKG